MLDASGTAELGPHIRLAQIVVPCRDLSEAVAFFVDRLAFKLNLIFPADAPSVAVVSGHGLSLRLESHQVGEFRAPVSLRLLCDLASLPAGTARELTGPDDIRVSLVEVNAPIDVPPGVQEFVVSRFSKGSGWGTGRAGMLYRDLIPSRLGGRFIASHIWIPDGGPVPDYVHFHKIRFQMIFCRSGWARLVYEDQGDPFVLAAGDCVLQPPEIRHRVLEASPGLEVVEIGCPAIHETIADNVISLPTGRMLPERFYGSQRFVRHVASTASWGAWRASEFEMRDTGIEQATDGLAGARVIRSLSHDDVAVDLPPHSGELLFLFILAGNLQVEVEGFADEPLGPNDNCVIPAGARYSLRASPDLEMLEVTLPAILTSR